MHHKRTFRVAPVASVDDLVQKLTEQTWTLCTGFRLDDAGRAYLFLNDATGEDGAQEYAVFRQTSEGWLQVESVTFSWCTAERAREIILGILAGQEVPSGTHSLRLGHPDHACPLCA